MLLTVHLEHSMFNNNNNDNDNDNGVLVLHT